jgi:hypothetical protein
LVTNRIFYVYVFFRNDGTPYYVGKGKGGRAWWKRKAGVKPPKNLNLVKILVKDLSESEAYEWEIDLIALLGRKDLGTGCLRNRTDGGEGASGAVRSEEFKNNMRGDNNINRKRPHPGRGKVGITDGTLFRRIGKEEEIPEGWVLGAPDSFKKSIKEGHHDVSGENNPVFGKRRITNGVRERRIPMDQPIPEGWVEGGKLKPESKIRSRPVELRSVEHDFALVFGSLCEAGEFIEGRPDGLKVVAGRETRSYLGWRVRYI